MNTFTRASMPLKFFGAVLALALIAVAADLEIVYNSGGNTFNGVVSASPVTVTWAESR